MKPTSDDPLTPEERKLIEQAQAKLEWERQQRGLKKDPQNAYGTMKRAFQGFDLDQWLAQIARKKAS